MNFQEAEKKYNDLRTQHNAGKLSDADFETEVGKLKLQDDQGRWWMIGVQSGEWYMHDGQKWAKGKPPIPAATPAPSASVAPAPDTSRKPVEKPKPIIEDKSKPVEDDKSKASGGLPARLFSPKPAGREGGKPLSRNVIIGIVATVVVLLLVCVGVGYFVILPMVSGQNTTAKTTPTVVAAKTSPTGVAVIPTLPPVATNTPFIAPTVPLPPTPVSSTVSTTSTTSSAASSASVSSKAAGPTATKKPVGTLTPTKVALTPTPAAPPGVYVTKISTDPAAPNFNEPMGFRVTFFNNTSGIQTYTWKVKIFKCAAACSAEDLAINKSVGETTPVQSNIAVGSVDLILPKNWTIGVGVCTLVLNPYYLDGNSNLVPFLTTDGKQIFQQVNMCR